MSSNQIDIKEYKKALKACQGELRVFINENNCNPILVRLAWHDSGTYDKNVKEWPLCGGANGSIIYKEVLSHGANAGLVKAVNYLKPFKTKYPLLSYADIIQMASAESILLAGGPKIDMIYGRLDTDICPKEGNLPDAAPPFKGEKSAKEHLQNVFFRMGFNSKEIVCLSGAHTLGRAFNERSGTTAYGYGASKGTKFTSGEHIARKDSKPGVGMPGGQSWTKNWLTFDNSYFTEDRSKKENGLLWLETDKAVAEDTEFKKWFELYRKDEKAFFEDYKAVHKKLSELGSKFFVAGGIRIEDTAAKL